MHLTGTPNNIKQVGGVIKKDVNNQLNKEMLGVNPSKHLSN